MVVQVSFWEIVWFIFIFFAFAAYLMVIFSIIGDLIRDTTVTGVMKAVWTVCLIFFPPLTALVYLVVRGGGMAGRAEGAAQAARQRQEDYVRSLAGAGMSPTEQIAKARDLLDSNAITPAEYESLKQRALA